MLSGNRGAHKGLSALAGMVIVMYCIGILSSVLAQAMEIRIGADPVKTQGRSGGINYQKTIDAVEGLGGNTVRLMMKRDYHLSTLEAYLKNFKQLRVSPNLNGATPPHGRNMKAWAKYFGDLSLQYPKLTGFMSDDFVPERHVEYRPDSVKAWMNVLKGINSNLTWLPVLYYDVRAGLKYYMDGNPYKAVMTDGCHMSYWASFRGDVNLKMFKLYLEEAEKIMPEGGIYTNIYPHRSGKIGSSNGACDNSANLDSLFHYPDTLRKMLKMALQYSDHIHISTWHPLLEFADTAYLFSTAEAFDQRTNDKPEFDFMLSSGGNGRNEGTYALWYQGVTATVPLPNNVGQASVSFKVADSKDSTSEQHFLYKQLIVDDKIAWEADVLNDGKATETINQSIVSHVKGDSAKITIRLFAKRGLWPVIKMYVGGITVRVNNATIPTTFKFESGIANIGKYVETYQVLKEVLSGASGIRHNGRTNRSLQARASTYGHRASIGYHLNSKERASLRVYDMKGRLIRHLFEGQAGPGFHTMSWDTRRMADGVYFLDFKAGRAIDVNRFVKTD